MGCRTQFISNEISPLHKLTSILNWDCTIQFFFHVSYKANIIVRRKGKINTILRKQKKDNRGISKVDSNLVVFGLPLVSCVLLFVYNHCFCLFI